MSTDNKENPPNNPSWGLIDRDLRDALATWEELTKKLDGKKTAEEEQLEEVRKLLASLQNKMKELET